MRIAVIQASSQIDKNDILFRYTSLYGKNSDVINFGCAINEGVNYSYIDIALIIGMLLNAENLL